MEWDQENGSFTHYSLFIELKILKIALLKLFLLKIVFVDECTSQLPKLPTVSFQTLLLWTH